MNILVIQVLRILNPRGYVSFAFAKAYFNYHTALHRAFI
ncbi:hypothetical protein JCM19298_531 [Nonlabens ulvanivorans]|nr:hypothetical protein JCM19298_531 [Nonlabens ulvanivorans]